MIRTAHPASGRLLRREAGFTLMEIIVVLLVFAIMSVMAYGGLGTVMSTRTAVEAAMTRTTEYQKAYMRLRNDFQNIRDRPARDNYGDVQPAFSGTREGAVEFTRGGWRNPLFLPRSSMERVTYALEDGKLMRATWRVLDRAQDSVPVKLPLLDKVDEIRWRYLDRQNEWQESWPPQSQNSGQLSPSAPQPTPPRAVELTLLTKDWGELRFLFKITTEPNQNFVTPPPSGTPGDPDGNAPPSPEPDGGGSE